MKPFLLFLTLLAFPGWSWAAPPARGTLTVHDVGEYAAVPWGKPGAPIEPGSRRERVKDLTFAIASVNLNHEDSLSQAALARWAKLALWGVQQGKKLLPRVYFWDGRDRYQGPMRDVDEYWNRLDRFLGAMNLDHFSGIVLAEENVNYAGRPQVLAELYRRIKRKYQVPVWQWWSPQTAVPGSGGWIPADGWVIDPYFKPRAEFRRYLRKYLITGLPVVVMPWASDEREVTDAQWQANQAQLDAAVEFNLPVAFYWVSHGSCYFGGRRDAHEELLDRVNQLVWKYLDRVRALPPDYTGLPSADLGTGRLHDVGPTEHHRFVFTDGFSTSRCVDDADMTGFRDLVLNGETLAARGFRGRNTEVELVYRFGGDLAVRRPQVQLDAEVDPSLNGRVEIALSADGKQWRCSAATRAPKQRLEVNSTRDTALAETHSFQVRIRMTGRPGTAAQPPCRIDNLRVSAQVMPPRRPVVTLRPAPEDPNVLTYDERFDTRKYALLTRREGDDRIEWSPGRLAVRLRPGGTEAALVWHLQCERPVHDLHVELEGRANTGSLGTNYYLDVSPDGVVWSETTGTRGRKTDVNGWTREPLVLNLTGHPTFTGIREFYVRIRMTAQSYKKIHPVQSGLVTRLRITAHSFRPKG